MFETGVFVAAGAFSGTNIENDTSDWYTKTVSIFVRRPDHFNVLLRQAAKLATATKVRKVNPREREVSVEFSRSSPPLEDHELDMGECYIFASQLLLIGMLLLTSVNVHQRSCFLSRHSFYTLLIIL